MQNWSDDTVFRGKKVIANHFNLNILHKAKSSGLFYHSNFYVKSISDNLEGKIGLFLNFEALNSVNLVSFNPQNVQTFM